MIAVRICFFSRVSASLRFVMRWSYWCSILRQASLCTSCYGKTCVRSHGHTTKDRKSMESAFWRSPPFYSQSIWCHVPLCSHLICHSNRTVKFLCKNWSPLKRSFHCISQVSVRIFNGSLTNIYSNTQKNVLESRMEKQVDT